MAKGENLKFNILDFVSYLIITFIMGLSFFLLFINIYHCNEVNYVYEKDEIVTIYNADKDLNNIQQNGTNYSFEYYIKYNVTKVFNYNFLPDDYKCYIDYKDNLIIYTFIYNKENVGTETIQYCFSDELVSKMTVIENLEKNLIEGQLTYKKEFHEFKLIDNDLYRDYAKIFNIS